MRIEPTNASEFRQNNYFENLAKIKIEKPEVFKILSESERLTLVIYLEQKTKHQQERTKSE